VASIVAASIIKPPFSDGATGRWGDGAIGRVDLVSPSPPVALSPRRHIASALNGIDVLERDGFVALKGRRVGLITDHTGRAREGRTTIDLLKAAPDVKLVALFSPEHGIRGVMDEKVANSVDEKTGLPIYSLYGE